MTVLANTFSLVEQAKRIDPDGTQATIVEVLNRKMGGMLAEFPWLPSNSEFTNKTTRRGSLPSGSRRKLNAFVTPSTSRTTEIMDVIENLEDYSNVDKDLVDSMPSPGMFRAGEADAFIEGLGQTIVGDVLYADSNADPDAMHGLSARMSTLDGRFVIGEGGSGSDVTSIYIVTPGQADVHFIYPKNMQANLGVKHTDLGEQTEQDVDTKGLRQVYRDHYKIQMGLVVRNPRSIGRLANIETAGASNTFDEDNLITLLNNMNINGNSRIYANETIITQMQIRAKDKANIYYTIDGGDGLSGMPPMRFQGVPIRKIDREILVNTEVAIS